MFFCSKICPFFSDGYNIRMLIFNLLLLIAAVLSSANIERIDEFIRDIVRNRDSMNDPFYIAPILTKKELKQQVRRSNFILAITLRTMLRTEDKYEMRRLNKTILEQQYRLRLLREFIDTGDYYPGVYKREPKRIRF